MQTIELNTKNGASCKIALNGAHVFSWCTADGQEQLFLSRRTAWKNNEAIRGGIPVIFPQFADMGPLVKHGFARSSVWHLLPDPVGDDADDSATVSCVRLCLTEQDLGDASEQGWDYRFHVELMVTLSDDTLQLRLMVTNTDTRPIAFQSGFHPYFRIACRYPEVIGLRPTRCFDKLTQQVGVQPDSAGMVITSAIDTIYSQSQEDLVLNDHDRHVSIRRLGFQDTVVWTPWDGAGDLPDDLESGDGRLFLCVEPINVDNKVQLAPGKKWIGDMCITTKSGQTSSGKRM